MSTLYKEYCETVEPKARGAVCLRCFSGGETKMARSALTWRSGCICCVDRQACYIQ